MKPFSLEEYLKNPDREVVTRSGEPVRIICTDRPAKQPIVALVAEAEDGYSDIRTYSANGQYVTGEKCNFDLFFAPTRHEGWMNVYRDKRGTVYGNIIYDSEKRAKFEKSDEDYITTIKVEWEE